MSEAELKTWAEAHATAGSVIAREVLRLLAELDGARRIALGLADRVHAQSEILSRRAEATR